MHTPVSLTPMNIHTLTVRNRFVLPGMVASTMTSPTPPLALSS